MLEMLAIAMVAYTGVIVLLIARRKRRNFGLKHHESRRLPDTGSSMGGSCPMGFSDGY
jgi:hypothetical protein